MKNDNIVGINIAYYRKINCLTQEELANLIGVSTQAVSKWEQQLTCPDIMLLPKIAKIFNITMIKYLFTSFKLPSPWCFYLLIIYWHAICFSWCTT